jgi:hypothetical protein
MGYDLNTINNEVEEELKCGICRKLLECPQALSNCEHIFCGKCLNECLAKHLICPIDRKSVTHSQIKVTQNFFKTLFEISCDFVAYGCK